MWMQATCAVAAADGKAGKTRTYYVAADEVQWDYAPSGRDEAMGMAFDAIARASPKPAAPHRPRLQKRRLSRVHRRHLHRLKPRSPEDAYLGILGPILHAEVGDTFKVVFKNNATHPFGMHPHGVLYQKDSEGADYSDDSGDKDEEDGCIAPGAHPHLHLAGS